MMGVLLEGVCEEKILLAEHQLPVPGGEIFQELFSASITWEALGLVSGRRYDSGSQVR